MIPSVTAVELRVVEDVLHMGNGYVLDFSDRSFAAFFEDFGVDIHDDRYCGDGLSKAKRLRRFLRTVEPELAGRVLKALWEYRLLNDSAEISNAQRTAYEKLVERLLGARAAPAAATESRAATDEEVLGTRFRPELFDQLPIEPALKAALRARVVEAESCLRVGAHLSVVILCGSVVEGLCLGFAANHPSRAQTAYSERFNKRAPARLEDWNLFEWLAVLRHLGDLSPTVEKYGQVLRDFRNYVHPGHQMRVGFVPDEHNAHIALHVVFAAIADLARNAMKVTRHG